MPVLPALDPYSIAAEGLIAVLNDEFATEGVQAIHDKLHESMGRYRIDVGVSPLRESTLSGNRVVQETFILVQFYGLWTEEIDPETMVDPREVTNRAHRFRRAVRAAQVGVTGSPEVWYYRIDGIDYPDDPTGNKSRFEATLSAHGDNKELIETT